MTKQATDTFVAVLKDGSDRLVVKGEVFPDGHELVKRDLAGSGTLFRDLDMGETEDEPAVKPRARPGKAGQ